MMSLFSRMYVREMTRAGSRAQVPEGRPLKLKFDALAAMERHVVQVHNLLLPAETRCWTGRAS
jgi:hypothetical protein